MKKPILIIVSLMAAFCLAFSIKPKKQKPFPDFGYMAPPSEVTNVSEVFKLSQSYPKTLPKNKLPEFYSIDYKKDWRKYLLSIRSYCYEGNTGVDFRVENNKTRNWYHMPFQHYSANGREGYHGLTREAPVGTNQFGPNQSYPTAGAWAVGFYNNIAGYTIGQVWQDHENPDVNKMNGGFKHGAVLFKLLFTSFPKEVAESQVAFLTNGIWWDAYGNYVFNDAPLSRSKIQVVLTQMDVMVRDTNSASGWVLGNFQYNGQLNNADKWNNLIPVGVMWGQDPTNNINQSNPHPTVTIINTNLKETIINPDPKELPPTHLGWNGRLNGPLDNAMSSCYSCHATAEYPQGSPLSPLFDSELSKKYPPGSDGWMRWFENLKCDEPFDKPSGGVVYHSTDFSLQMSQTLQFFADFQAWKDAQGGLYRSSYEQPVKKRKTHSVSDREPKVK
jgi:hypothetical protein